MSQRGKGNKPISFAGDLIALGAKSGSVGPSKRGEGQGGTSSSSLAGGPSGSHMKKGKAPSGGASMAMYPGSSASKSIKWENLALDNIDVTDLAKAVLAAEEANNMSKIEGLLCGAVKLLRNQRAKPDQLLYLPLLYLAKSNGYLFSASEHILDAFCSLLKRDVKESYKSKGNALVSVLAANVLMAAYHKERNWPDMFIRVYIDDAMGERVWVDHPDCRGFVDNILTAFNTKVASTSHSFFPKPGSSESSGREQCASPPVGGGGSGSGSGSATPTRIGDDDSMQGIETGIPINIESKESLEVSVSSRYVGLQSTIENLVMDAIREQLNRRQGTDNITRNFLKFLTSTCGLAEVRMIVVSKIEMWIMNPKLSRIAHDLLLSLSVNCNTHTPIDVEVIGNFAKLRFKNKPNINLYLQCVREICNSHPENLPTLIKHTIFNELSNARNTNNMSVLNVMFNTDSERAPASLASVFLDLLMQKECYLRALRALLREIARALKHDINLQIFCQHLMQDKSKEQTFKDFEFKERMFISITDLISLAMFLGISPAVREAFSAYTKGEKRDLSPFRSFLKQVALIQRDAMWWFFEVVIKAYKLSAGNMYAKCLHKVLFMISHEEYSMVDGWPAESERHLYFKATSEIPLYQETLLRIFFIGLSKTHPLNGRDTVDLAEFLTKRAAALHSLENEDFRVLFSEVPTEVFEYLIKLSTYSYPDTITLPSDYNPPILAIAPAYWKMFVILVLYCAHNPAVYGSIGWKEYPTLKAFMEMCITNQFVFPPPTLATGDQAEVLKAKEVQITAIEKQKILTLEQHLAAATNHVNVNETNSLLLPQLITLDPTGALRRPPQPVLEQLQQLNKHHRIGHLLCRSRNPDFLLDILNRQGPSQAMPWLADLVESNESSFNVLPVQCLCEFLLNSGVDSLSANGKEVDTSEITDSKRRKQKQLLLHLQSLLQNPESDKQVCCETLDYFLRRLSSQQTQQRLQALKGLRLVLTPSVAQENHVQEVDIKNQWLLQHLPSLPFFTEFYPNISHALRSACQVENDPQAVGLYIQFLASYRPSDIGELANLCLEMASIIVERSTIVPAILPGPQCKADNADDTLLALLRLFTDYMNRIMSHKPEMTTWNAENASEIIAVVFKDMKTAHVHYFVVHAQIILLTFRPTKGQSVEYYNNMLNIWFAPQYGLPRSFLLETKEEAVLIPDWLKLKMIRSDEPILVDAALKDLEPHQLVLFIQSFGIPAMSMTKLLKALDVAVQSDIQGVTEAVMDKNYMEQLVAVQYRRGAVNGKIFADLLELNLNAHLKNIPGDDHDDEDEKRIISIGSLAEPVVPPRSTAIIPPNQIKTTLLHLFDVGSPSRMKLKEKQDTFRTLQKFLAAEHRGNAPINPMLEATVKAFDNILKGDLKFNFISALYQRTPFSCGLIRLVTTSLLQNGEQTAAKSFARSCEIILAALPDNTTTPLPGLLSSFLSKIRPKIQKKETASQQQKDNFEKDFHKKVEESLSKRNTAHLVSSMANMLLNRDKLSTTKNIGDAKAGLIIDWLEMVDPELVQLKPEIQQQLLFSKSITSRVKKENQKNPERISVPSRPYLLSMLTHQANWNSLRKTIDHLLASFNSNLDPTAVLDFLIACILIPKLWRGRDKHIPKHEVDPDVLALNEDQLDCLVDYVLMEAHSGNQEAQIVFKDRTQLLLRCLPDKTKARWASDYLISKLRGRDDMSASFPKSLVQQLLLQIYMKVPNCLNPAVELQVDLPDKIEPNEGVSSFDSVSHTLLSALAATQQGRQWATQMVEFEASARKLSSSHPLLMLRNLPLIAASLKGRTDYEFSFFRSRNHLTLYSISLGLLETLKPYVFRPEFQNPLEEALKCYFEMLNSYFHRRDAFFGVIDKFIIFLHDYIDAKPSRALNFIRTHGSMLPEMAHSLPSLKNLIPRVDFKGQPSAHNLLEGSFSKQSRNEVVPEINRLSRMILEGKDDEILTALSDLSHIAKSKPYILEHFTEEICSFISDENASLRNMAIDLLSRLWRTYPNLTDHILGSYINCLNSEDQGVVTAALKKLPDFVILAQDRIGDLLKTVFSLGLYSNVNVNTYLSEAIAFLNTQSGY